MNTILHRAFTVGALLTLGALIALFATSGAHAIVFDVYVLAVGAVIMLALLRAVHASGSERHASQFARALAAMRAEDSPRGELTAERDVELARGSAFHYHVRIRPALRQIAAYRLRLRYGIDLDREPERAREVVPSRAWEVVRPDRPMPKNRLARGPSVAEQRTVLEELERL